MILNRADITELLNTLVTLNIDSFKLIKNDTSGIGYTLDIEHDIKNKDNETVTIVTQVVGTEDW